MAVVGVGVWCKAESRSREKRREVRPGKECHFVGPVRRYEGGMSV